MKIILTNPPSQGDFHADGIVFVLPSFRLPGCPFRHSDPELLKQKLQSYKVPSAGITQIVDLVKGMHFQLACQKYFELIHNVEDCGFSLNHPNQYFAESQRLLTGGKDIKKEPVALDSSQKKQSSQKSTSSVSSSNPASSGTSAVPSADMEDLEKFFDEC